MPARDGDDHEPVYTIAVAARLTRMHPQTLRKYERAGLVSPSRSAGSQRFYSVADVARLRRIQYLVDALGLNLAGVDLALRMTDRLDATDREATVSELWLAIDEATLASRGP
jgi:MerR family transcriptional regulator, heat shock protein HspR